MTMTMATVNRSDTEIGRHVVQELEWDSRIDERDLRVTVQAGTVTLDGSVGAYAQKIAAADAAHRVAGVLDVVNELRVVPSTTTARSDAEIAAAVRHALEWDSLVHHQDIRCTVSNGWVRLEGTASCWSARAEAERTVKFLTGVHGITNAICVVPPQINVTGVREAIESALERLIEREARRIRVEVTDGTVILSGAVKSWAEKRAVLGAAAHAPGVRSVEDHLHVDPV